MRLCGSGLFGDAWSCLTYSQIDSSLMLSLCCLEFCLMAESRPARLFEVFFLNWIEGLRIEAVVSFKIVKSFKAYLLFVKNWRDLNCIQPDAYIFTPVLININIYLTQWVTAIIWHTLFITWYDRWRSWLKKKIPILNYWSDMNPSLPGRVWLLTLPWHDQLEVRCNALLDLWFWPVFT